MIRVGASLRFSSTTIAPPLAERQAVDRPTAPGSPYLVALLVDHQQHMTERENVPYDPVPHSHVVPTGYLRAWARGNRIAMRRVGLSDSRSIGIRDAGVRKNFYRRERPDSGTAIYDVEWSLGQAETAALSLVSNLSARWPLNLDDKGKIGQFFALQHLRGVAFRQWHGDHVASVLDEIRANPEAALKPHPGRTTTDGIEELTVTMTSDTYRLTKMLKLVRCVGIVFTSMHWSLVEFHRGRLATSDHPVVVWPLGGGTSRKPSANDLQAGVTESLEVFMPAGPTHLLLMTWRDQKSIGTSVHGRGRHLATANAFVVANADTQWFHEPDIDPWIARGRRPPLGPELLAGYDLSEASGSHRRARAAELANAEARRDLSNDPVEVVSEDALPASTDRI